MPITPTELGGDEDAARRILVRARVIAPCIDSLDGEDRKNAIAVLKGVLAELPAPGARRTRSLSRNGTAVTFDAFESAFTASDEADLRALCGLASSGADGASPVGSFPLPDCTVSRLYPERADVR